MKYLENKKINFKTSVLFLAVVICLLISAPVSVNAQVYQGSLCYDSGSGTIQVPENETATKACTGEGYKIIKAGEAVPTRICIVKNVGEAFPVESGNEQYCGNVGGQIVQQGQPLPEFNVGSADEAKNRAENTQTPAPVTSEDRDAIRNCSAGVSCVQKNPIVGYTLLAINVLSAGVGVIVTIMIIIGGIQYSSAGGDPGKVKAAKSRITNAIIALIAYFFLYGFVQWLVPGGII